MHLTKNTDVFNLTEHNTPGLVLQLYQIAILQKPVTHTHNYTHTGEIYLVKYVADCNILFWG